MEHHVIKKPDYTHILEFDKEAYGVEIKVNTNGGVGGGLATIVFPGITLDSIASQSGKCFVAKDVYGVERLINTRYISYGTKVKIVYTNVRGIKPGAKDEKGFRVLLDGETYEIDNSKIYDKFSGIRESVSYL